MKKKLSTIGLILVFILGFLILMYPTLSNYYNQIKGSYTIGEYDKEIEKIDEIDLNKIYENAKKYNENLLQNPTSIKSGKPQDENYKSQLKISEDDSIMGYIEIKKIKLRLPIYHGTAEPVLQKGIGHLEGTSLPIGGKGTHAVLTGHTGLPEAKLFTDIDLLKKGDLIRIKVLDKTITYKVDNTEVVLPKEVNNLTPIEGEDKLTLMTCTPYGVNSHRLLIHANRTKNVAEEKESKIEEEATKNINVRLILMMMAIIIVVIIIYLISRKYKKGQ